jgi:hypothetical protein
MSPAPFLPFDDAQNIFDLPRSVLARVQTVKAQEDKINTLRKIEQNVLPLDC